MIKEQNRSAVPRRDFIPGLLAAIALAIIVGVYYAAEIIFH